RHVVEQVPDLDARAGRAVPGRDRPQFPALAGDLRPADLVGGPRLQLDLGDAADGGEGLAAEAEGVDAEEVLGRGELAGGVAGEGQGQVLGGNAATVVHHLDQIGASPGHLDVDAGAARVEGVLQQLLDDAGRPLHDLARGDLVDEVRRQLAD